MDEGQSRGMVGPTPSAGHGAGNGRGSTGTSGGWGVRFGRTRLRAPREGEKQKVDSELWSFSSLEWWELRYDSCPRGHQRCRAHRGSRDLESLPALRIRLIRWYLLRL
nr:hypothetical protein CFP56_60703 [Quercus suber]